MYIPAQTKALILEEMKKPNADIAKVSVSYAVPIRIIREITGIQRGPAVYLERHGGLGRPELQQFIISRCRAGHPWPPGDAAAIAQARTEFDAGLVEMATGRDGDWLILYKIPRKKRDTKREPYFAEGGAHV